MSEEVIEQTENKEPEAPKKKKKTKLKYALNISIVLIVTAVAIIINLSGNAGLIFKTLGTISWNWLLIVLLCVLTAAAIRAFVVFCFARLFTKKYSYFRALACDQIGVFYSAVTPGASGGQVMQAYTLKKQGLPISSAVSMLAMQSIIYQIVLIVFGVISFVVKYKDIMSIKSIAFEIGKLSFAIPMWPLTILGFLLNVGVIGVVLLMGYWKGFHNFVMGPCISLLNKIRLVKNPDKMRENLRVSVENFKIEMRRLATNIPFTILIAICFSLFIMVNYSVPYFVGQSLHNESLNASIWDSIWLSNYHQMVTGLIPIPGGAGVSEIVFDQLFCFNPGDSNCFFYIGGANAVEDSLGLAKTSLLIWRAITFTVPMIIAGFVTAFYHASPKDDISEETGLASHQTMVELERETISQRQMELDTLVETSKLTREAILSKLRDFSKSKKDKPKSKKNGDDDFTDVTIDHEDDSI